ncbi:hypothetical protein B0H10DRAFT_1966354 [Mycena sp. CBHHK59/15]|nr:hypothetical protein B0H10DRAFT_1966354 [Mycena sp. CBHHK59/15]
MHIFSNQNNSCVLVYNGLQKLNTVRNYFSKSTVRKLRTAGHGDAWHSNKACSGISTAVVPKRQRRASRGTGSQFSAHFSPSFRYASRVFSVEYREIERWNRERHLLRGNEHIRWHEQAKTQQKATDSKRHDSEEGYKHGLRMNIQPQETGH